MCMLAQQTTERVSGEEIGESGAALWTYWTSLARPGLVPYRRDFDPMAIKRVLPVVSLMEMEGPDTWRLRLVGTEICRRAGRDLTGLNYLDLLTHAPARASQAQRLATMMGHPCGATGDRRNIRSSGLEYRVRILSLPLRDSEGRIRLLVTTNEEIERRHWLGAERDSFEELSPVDSKFVDIGAGTPTV
jgi:hypothetical protein